jgi:hypothetical protein
VKGRGVRKRGGKEREEIEVKGKEGKMGEGADEARMSPRHVSLVPHRALHVVKHNISRAQVPYIDQQWNKV